MKNLVREIINAKISCIFISPHFDDAILSAGAFIYRLSKYTDLKIINVFTKADKQPLTLSANAYLRQVHYSDAERLFADRESEDSKILSELGVEVINLNYVDALWRKRRKSNLTTKFLAKWFPEIVHIYPTYRWHMVNRISVYDLELIEKLTKEIMNLIPPKVYVFCPLSLGNHVDHQIVKKACEQLPNIKYYWEDFPYSIYRKGVVLGTPAFVYGSNLKIKRALVKKYTTQYQALFGDKNMPLIPEKYHSGWGLF